MLDLYKDLIIDHGLNPRNKYVMNNYTASAKGFNHFCGDSVTLYLNLSDNNIKDISFDGVGCTVSLASASLMTNIFKNKKISEANAILDYFQKLIKNNTNINDDYLDINILAVVNKFPSRVKCVTLIWHTFKTAVNKK